MENNLTEISESEEIPNPIRSLLSMEITGDAIFHKHCALCNSPHRKNTEEMFDEGKTIPNIQRFLEEKGEKINICSIKYHFNEHYKNLERMAFLLDYCDRYDDLALKRRKKENDLQVLIDTAIIELSRAINIKTKGDICKEKIRNEMILKTMSSIRESISSKNDMEESDAKVRAIESACASAWKKCIDEASPEEKQLYALALKKFKEILNSFRS